MSDIQRKPQTKRDRRYARAMHKVWRNAKPGMKVRCVADLSESSLFMKVDAPRQGEVYTIRELPRGLYRAWAVGFTLVEVVNRIDPDYGSEPFFGANEFEILDGDT